MNPGGQSPQVRIVGLLDEGDTEMAIWLGCREVGWGDSEGAGLVKFAVGEAVSFRSSDGAFVEGTPVDGPTADEGPIVEEGTLVAFVVGEEVAVDKTVGCGVPVGSRVGCGVAVGAGEIVGTPLKPQPQGEENSGAARQVPGLIFPAKPFISNLPQVTPGSIVMASGSEIQRPSPHTSHAGNSPGGLAGTGGQLLVGPGVGTLEGELDGKTEGCRVGCAEIVGNWVGITEGSDVGNGLMVGAVGSMLGVELGDAVVPLVVGCGLVVTNVGKEEASLPLGA